MCGIKDKPKMKESDIKEQKFCYWCGNPHDNKSDFCSERCILNWVNEQPEDRLC